MNKNPSKKILMVLYSYYPHDPRPRREIEALIQGGYQVDLICLRGEGQLKKEKKYGCNVYRVNLQRSRTSKFKYIQLYLSFCIRSFFVLNWMYINNRYDAIHAHNMPDFLVFPAVIPKIFGSKIILDLHDPSPEILMTIFNKDKDSRLFKIIVWIEKMSIKFSDIVITVNKAFVDTFISRGSPREKLRIIMNSPQTSVFEKFTKNAVIKPRGDKFVLMYHGLIVERHGLDIMVEALKILRHKIVNLEMIICGYGEYEGQLLKNIKESNLEDIVNFIGEVTIDKIAETIPQIDVGIIPNKITPFTEINFPTRIFEYISNKKPAVVPRTTGIRDYFAEDEIFYFNGEDVQDLVNVIMEIYLNHEKVKGIIEKSYQIYKKHTWEIQSNSLLQIYDELTHNSK
jgi:glycosyltransferase involved in cell wall biosynthesis